MGSSERGWAGQACKVEAAGGTKDHSEMFSASIVELPTDLERHHLRVERSEAPLLKALGELFKRDRMRVDGRKGPHDAIAEGPECCARATCCEPGIHRYY